MHLFTQPTASVVVWNRVEYHPIPPPAYGMKRSPVKLYLAVAASPAVAMVDFWVPAVNGVVGNAVAGVSSW